MAYSIQLSNGTTLVPGGLSDGTVDTTHSSLILVGANYAGYGQFINENFIRLLENFSFSSSPANPLRGQLWWDTVNNILKVYSGTSWKISTGATAAPFVSPPGDLSTTGGDLWFDSTNSQLKVYTGNNWVTVGPTATPATGDTGAFPALMADSSSSEQNASHIVIQFRFSGKIYAILAKETFACNLAGFSLIKAGLNFSTIESPQWVLNTQDVNATASTLVQRDTGGGIRAVTVNATTIVASSSVSAPSFIGPVQGDITGNVSATNMSVSGTINAGEVKVGSSTVGTSGFSGTILSASQPNITTIGTLTSLNVTGATQVAAITSSGTVIASTVNAGTIGNTSTTLTGTLSTAAQPNITSIGTLTNLTVTNPIVGTLSTAAQTNITSIGTLTDLIVSGTISGTLSTAAQPNITSATGLITVGSITTGEWRSTPIAPGFGGTGVNNGANTLILSGGNYTLNQAVTSGASPTFFGPNFSQIPTTALVNRDITVTAGTGMSGGGSMNLGGSVTLTNAGVTSVVSGTGVGVSGATGAVTVSIGQAVATSSSPTFAAMTLTGGLTAGGATGVTGTLTVTGAIRATDNVTAYYSDDRLKNRLGTIENALDKVDQLTGFYYEANQTAQDLGYTVKREVGISAQDVQKVLPEIVTAAPIDDKYLTVYYDRLAPLLIEAIKELRAEVNDIKRKLGS